MKIKSTLFFLIFVLISSCGEKKKDVSENANQLFFDVVYETLAVREISTSDWFLTDGDRDVKFSSDVKISDEESLPDFVNGTVDFLFVEFVRTQALEACSGGWKGDFILDLFLQGGSESDVQDAGNPPYSVLDPYDPTGGAGTPIDPDDVVENIRTYHFSISVKNKSLYPENSWCSPFNEHSLKVVRFPNGTLIMTDFSKGLEYFLRPKLRTVR